MCPLLVRTLNPGEPVQTNQPRRRPGRRSRSQRWLKPTRSAPLLTALGLALFLGACDDRTASSPSDDVDGLTPAEARSGGDGSFVGLFEAALHETLARRAARGVTHRSRIVLDVPETRRAYSEAGDGPTLGHVREALSRVGSHHGDMEWVEGSSSEEIACERQEGYPPEYCSMDPHTLVLRVTPRRPEWRLGLENGDHTVDVKTRERTGHQEGRLMTEIHHMTFRYVGGEWRLVDYGIGQA